MSDKKIQEGLADLAQRAEHDHEVQMARADLYKIAKYAIKLHDMLKNISETEGLEGWQQAKITKASDYISSVYHNLDYDMKFGEAQQEVTKKKSHSKIAEKITKDMSAGEIIADFQNSKDPKFKGKSKEERKEMALAAYYEMHPEKSNESVKLDTYKSGISKKLSEALNRQLIR